MVQACLGLASVKHGSCTFVDELDFSHETKTKRRKNKRNLQKNINQNYFVRIISHYFLCKNQPLIWQSLVQNLLVKNDLQEWFYDSYHLFRELIFEKLDPHLL